jgi:hypothetical protein
MDVITSKTMPLSARARTVRRALLTAEGVALGLVRLLAGFDSGRVAEEPRDVRHLDRSVRKDVEVPSNPVSIA